MNRLVRFDYLQKIGFSNTYKPIVRLNPSILLMSRNQIKFTPVYSVENRDRSSKIQNMIITDCEIKKNGVENEDIMTNEMYHDEMYRILDLTYIDVNFKHIRNVYKKREYLDDIYTELKSVEQKYNIVEKMDGYLLDGYRYIFFTF